MAWVTGDFLRDFNSRVLKELEPSTDLFGIEEEEEDNAPVLLLSNEGVEFSLTQDQLAYWGESFANAAKDHKLTTTFSTVLIEKIVNASLSTEAPPLIYLEDKFKTLEEIWELRLFAEFYAIPTLKDLIKRIIRSEGFLQSLNEERVYGILNSLTNCADINVVFLKMALEVLLHYHLSRGEKRRAIKCLEVFFSWFHVEDFRDWLLAVPPKKQDLCFLTGALLKLGKRGVKEASSQLEQPEGKKRKRSDDHPSSMVVRKNEGLNLALEVLKRYIESLPSDGIANIGYFASLFRLASHVSSFQDALPLLFLSARRKDAISASGMINYANSTLKSNYFDTLFAFCYASFSYGESIVSSVIFQLALHALLQKNQVDDALALIQKYIEQIKWFESGRLPLDVDIIEVPYSKKVMEGIAAVLKMAMLYEFYSVKDSEEGVHTKCWQYCYIEGLWAQYDASSIEPTHFLKKNSPQQANPSISNGAAELFPYIYDKTGTKEAIRDAQSNLPIDKDVISFVLSLQHGKVEPAIALFRTNILNNLAKVKHAKSLLIGIFGHKTTTFIQYENFHKLLLDLFEKTRWCDDFPDLGILHLTLGIQLAWIYLRGNSDHLLPIMTYVYGYLSRTEDLQTIFEKCPYLYKNFIALLKNLVIKKLEIAFQLTKVVEKHWYGVAIRGKAQGSRVNLNALIPIKMAEHILANQTSEAIKLLQRFRLPTCLAFLNDMHRLIDKPYLSNDVSYELLKLTIVEKGFEGKELDVELWEGSFIYRFYMESKKRFDWQMLEFLNLRIKLDKHTFCQLAFRNAVMEGKLIDFKSLFLEEIDCVIAFDLGYMLHCILDKCISFDIAANWAATFQNLPLENYFLKGYLAGARARGKLTKTFSDVRDFSQALFLSLHTISRDSMEVNWKVAMQE